jgi:hypothetical protein
MRVFVGIGFILLCLYEFVSSNSKQQQQQQQQQQTATIVEFG